MPNDPIRPIDGGAGVRPVYIPTGKGEDTEAYGAFAVEQADIAAYDGPVVPVGLTGADIDIGTVNQGDPNAGGADSWNVQGAAASGAAVAGRPVLIGGSDGTNAQSFRTSASGGGSVGGTGILAANNVLWGGGADFRPQLGQNQVGDAHAALGGVPVVSRENYNGATFDRVRGNIQGVLLASASRATSAVSPDQTNYNGGSGLTFVRINVTVNPGGGETLALNVHAKMPNGDYIGFATTGAQTFGGAAGDYVIALGPGITASDDVDVATAYGIPRTWRVQVINSAAGAWTYSVEFMQNSN